MKCIKHRVNDIPCPTCMIDEYVYFQKQNDDLIKQGLQPKHDLTCLEQELRRIKLIP